MSVLWTAVKARYDAQELVELTNVRDTTATTIDDAQGERAVTAIGSYFPVYVQEAFDETNQGHLEIGVEGVVALLMRWGGSSHKIQASTWDEWKALAGDWKNTHARARIEPTTSVPTNKQSSDGPTTPYTPWSDNQRFEGLSPRTVDPTDADGEDA